MAISLIKGGSISLTQTAPSLKKLHLGLGWDARATDGQAFDLDAAAFLVGANGKCRYESDFVFYNNSESACHSVKFLGDNRTGEGEGDDEVITVDIEKIPEDVAKVVFVATIHESQLNHQNFGMVSEAFIRMVNMDNNQEIARFDLSEDACTNTAMIFGELYRRNNEWKFRAVGQGYDGGIVTLISSFGLEVN